MDYGDRCLIIPIIDYTKNKLEDSVVYVCWPNDQLAQILLYRDSISRAIDSD